MGDAVWGKNKNQLASADFTLQQRAGVQRSSEHCLKSHSQKVLTGAYVSEVGLVSLLSQHAKRCHRKLSHRSQCEWEAGLNQCHPRLA